MEETLTATYENGTLKLDRKLNLPEHAPVEVTIRARAHSIARRIGGRIWLDPELATYIAESDDLLGSI